MSVSASNKTHNESPINHHNRLQKNMKMKHEFKQKFEILNKKKTDLNLILPSPKYL